MSNSKRFGTMKATKFVNKIEVENEKQFSAITIIMPDNTLYADSVHMSGLETAFYSNNKEIYRFDIRKFHYSESRSKE